MKWVTLVVWLITAVGGFTLLGVWLQHGGMGSPATRRFPKALPWLHGLLAVVSLVLFLVYLFADTDALKPIVLIGLVLTAALGIAMFVMWLGRMRVQRSPAVGADVAGAPEDHFPNAIVALHGIAAVATLILYIVAAFVVAS
jgi:thiol:disulfide interchange protein